MRVITRVDVRYYLGTNWSKCYVRAKSELILGDVYFSVLRIFFFRKKYVGVTAPVYLFLFGFKPAVAFGVGDLLRVILVICERG